MESPFEVLLIEPDADEAEIRRAYRERVKDAHPDHGGSVREFQRVKAAYETLTSSDRSNGQVPWDGDGESADDELQREVYQVEYLNYEAIDDYGWGLEDDDLFEKASAEGLDPGDRGRILVQPNESLLEAAENRGFEWPYACRGGACANCAVAVIDGELSQPVNHILPPEMIDRGIRLSCVGAPIVDDMKVVYNIKHLPELEELRLPPRPFE